MGSIIHINVLKSQSYWFHPAFPRLFMASYKSQGPRFEDLVWKLPHQPGTGLLHSSGQAACHLSTCSKIRAPVERGGSLTVSPLQLALPRFGLSGWSLWGAVYVIQYSSILQICRLWSMIHLTSLSRCVSGTKSSVHFGARPGRRGPDSRHLLRIKFDVAWLEDAGSILQKVSRGFETLSICVQCLS